MDANIHQHGGGQSGPTRVYTTQYSDGRVVQRIEGPKPASAEVVEYIQKPKDELDLYEYELCEGILALPSASPVGVEGVALDEFQDAFGAGL